MKQQYPCRTIKKLCRDLWSPILPKTEDLQHNIVARGCVTSPESPLPAFCMLPSLLRLTRAWSDCLEESGRDNKVLKHLPRFAVCVCVCFRLSSLKADSTSNLRLNARLPPANHPSLFFSSLRVRTLQQRCQKSPLSLLSGWGIEMK